MPGCAAYRTPMEGHVLTVINGHIKEAVVEMRLSISDISVLFGFLLLTSNITSEIQASEIKIKKYQQIFQQRMGIVFKTQNNSNYNFFLNERKKKTP